MLRFLACLSMVVGLSAQAAPRVDVPSFPNPTCPIMGKKVSMPLFVDTDVGRFWVCCKPCYKKILANVQAAHKTAYPVVETVGNKTCPVSGEPIGEHAVEITLQAYRFKVCCVGCIGVARQHHQTVLARVVSSALVDVGNDTCPVNGEPVAPNAFVVVDGAIVHLSSPKRADDVSADPAAALARARKIAAAQPPKPNHEHTAKPVDAAKAADGAERKGGR